MEVTTIDGTLHPKSKCRRIKGEYYLIGDPKEKDSGQCYHIDGKYYKYNTGYIIYDHRIGEYVIKNAANIIEEGVVGVDGKKLIFGAFSKDPSKQVNVYYEGSKYICMDEEIFNNSIHFKEHLNTGDYYYRQAVQSVEFIYPSPCNRDYKFSLPYDSRGITDAAMALYDKLYEPRYNKYIDKFGDVMNGLSFGLEFETVLGTVPERKSRRLGLIPLRDGSIEGLEFVTIPLEGKKGIQTVVDTLEELEKRTIYDDDCSLHLHIGNIPRTEEFLLAFFKTICYIQDDMFALFPLYKKYNFGVKRKHYTKPFNFADTMFKFDPVINESNIKKNFDILYKFLSMGQSYYDVGADLSKVNNHPSDPRGTSKWNIRTRYHWCNLIPILFGNKATVEFRLHTSTYNANKIVNYMILCGAIVNYVKLFTNNILNGQVDPRLSDIIFDGINLKDTTKISNSMEVIDNLHNYIQNRQSFIYECSKKGDIIADESKFNIVPKINWSNINNMTKKRKNGYNLSLSRMLQDIRVEEVLLPDDAVPNIGWIEEEDDEGLF